MPLIASVAGHTPKVDDAAFIAPNATIVGDVTLAPGVSIWYGCVLRAEAAPIHIGTDTNVQDLTVIHTDADVPVAIGARVTVGHRAIIHGAAVGDDALVGMGAILLNNATVGPGALIAAGAVVREGFDVPAFALAYGVPAQIRPDTIDRDTLPFPNVAGYSQLSVEHHRANYPSQ